MLNAALLGKEEIAKLKKQVTVAIDGEGGQAWVGGIGGTPFTGTNKLGTFVDGVRTGSAPPNWVNGTVTAGKPFESGSQNNGYVSSTKPKDQKYAPQEGQSARLLAEPNASTGSGGSGYGMLASNQPLGSAIDEENRYLRQFGAVLLR